MTTSVGTVSNSSIDFNALALKHSQWVEAMGWHNKTVLESLALIQSEGGELLQELVSDNLYDSLNDRREEFSTELCDIILRISDLSVTEKVDLQRVVNEHQAPRARYNLTKGVRDPITELIIDMAHFTNASRKQTPNPDFEKWMGIVVNRVLSIADLLSINLWPVIEAKMALNLKNGTRGRKV